MAQYSFKNNEMEIDEFYSNKWKNYTFPIKATGFLVRQYQIPPIFIDVYKNFGENSDNYPLIKYGVNTSIFIYIDKWAHWLILILILGSRPKSSPIISRLAAARKY